METFPEDVKIAEKMVNGNPEIINSDEFQPSKTKKETWSDIFIDPNKKQKSKFFFVSEYFNAQKSLLHPFKTPE